MSTFLKIFPPRSLGKNLLWMVPASAGVTYLNGLDSVSGQEYLTGEYWSTWLVILGILVGLWFAVRLTRWNEAEKWKRYTKCPTCGQTLPRTSESSETTIGGL